MEGVQMSNHLGDINKMVSDTPRMDAAWKPDGGDGYPTVDVDLARQLERELNALNQCIKRLIEAGDRMDLYASPHDSDKWNEAKECK
jgi:hypothetical protein